MMTIPKLPVGQAIESGIDFLSSNFSFATKAFAQVVETGIDGIVSVMMFFHPLALIAILAILVWLITRQRGLTIFTALGLLLILNFGLWEPAVSTVALVVVATMIAIIIGLPLGILAALNKTAYRVTMPILDFMQTMPAFVYLIPAIPFFGLGVVAAIFSTVIFSVPPCIRLTCLGIREVPPELIEAADSFGSSKRQKLFKLQIPMATTTIMAGINQTIMLGLSMVVIASMIGAKGLGGEVWRAIQRLNPASGFEAGIGIVIIAIILDRTMQTFGSTK
jgi:glycine betaine/proline transport system permease protein